MAFIKELSQHFTTSVVIIFICLFYCLSCNGYEQSDETGNRRHIDAKSHHLSRHPRDASRRHRKRSGSERFGSVVNFNGNNNPLRLRFLTKEGRITLPNEYFTVQLWVKPAGGQSSYTSIVELYDECDLMDEGSWWALGIGLKGLERRDARFVFSLQTMGSDAPSHLFSHKRYEHREWTNIAITYDGETMNLYINGAKMSLGHEQDGPVYSEEFLKCKHLLIGNTFEDEIGYRGKLDEVRVWNRTLSHLEIVQNMFTSYDDLPADSRLIISDSFNNLNKWRVKSEFAPEIIKSDNPVANHHVRFEAPPCGKTVCDDPQLVLNYVNNNQLRNEKKIRYRVVNIRDDDGSNPILSSKEIYEQNKALSRIFGEYNITFDLEEMDIRNSTIRKRVIMFQCIPYKVGDGNCDTECEHSTTGNDGGDCDIVQTGCNKVLLGNGVCNTECNKAYHNYDDGDCCLPGDDTHKTCIDPKSPLRGYLNIEDIKMDLQLDGSSQINVFFITSGWFSYQFRGLATHPWEKNVYTSIGGNIVHVNNFGKSNRLEGLVHELGHNLGLWHVHRGISELKCDDECAETSPSMVTGDLCSDTNPTPRNTYCQDPFPDADLPYEETCGIYKFENTPYNNYMGYADDDCTNHFTPQQVARMHCYLDLVYRPMREMKSPAPVPSAPKVVKADAGSVTLVWIEPLGADSSCDADNTLFQYADIATSSHNGIRWSPQEATGFPDAEHCTPSRYAWMPNTMETPPDCDNGSCWLELGFKNAVVPKRINLWISYLEEFTELTVEIISTDGQTEDVGTVPAFCDMDSSLAVNTQLVIDKIRVYTSTSYVAIDAVEIVSDSNHPTCLQKKYPKYRLVRDPPFAENRHVRSANTEYTDSTVEAGVTYQYHVQAVLGSIPSVNSPVLAYTHGEPFCGDGMVSLFEECDDKNAFNGDGCSIECQIEEGFNCKEEPSLCYVYKDDGICEDFEVGLNTRDCGLYTPEGYKDQWAAFAETSSEHQLPECPPSAIVGKPDLFQSCGQDAGGSHTWRPCADHPDYTGNYWIEVSFYQPVVAVAVILHISADGATLFSPVSKSVHIDLITAEDKVITVQPNSIPISCHSNPIIVPIVHDLSQPFYLTKGVRISFKHAGVGLSAVGLRYSPFLNPVSIARCEEDELYNAKFSQCVQQTCAAECGTFPVKYGVASCTGNSNGDECSIACDKGYYVDGHENLAMCISGDWITSSPLACSPVDCGRPEVSEATAACPEGTLYTQQCHFKCDWPATLLGTDTTITCQEDGSWSEPKAVCQITCPPLDPGIYANGDLKTSACKRGHQSTGRQCKIKCRDGYHVEYERNRKRYLRVTCDVDGTWYGPRCISNVCPPLPAIFTGAVRCSDGYNSGSTCYISCPGDLTVFEPIKCNKHGEWKGDLDLDLDLCPLVTSKSCDKPKSTDHVLFDCVDHVVGGKCAVQCQNSELIPTSINDENAGQTFSNTPNDVDKIICTVMQKWEPTPESITCEIPCIKWTIGDGICEAENNRAMCQWDGGDCCASTVEDGEVMTIPDVCPIDCKCKDPDAVENSRRKRRRRFRQ